MLSRAIAAKNVGDVFLRHSVVGLAGIVGLALWLGSGLALALNKYRYERPV